MSGSETISVVRTEDLSVDIRAMVVQVCVAAFGSDDFRQMFAHIPSGGRHFLAWRDERVVCHAVVTTRWLQPEGFPALKTAYVDAVATLPACQGQGVGSAVMRRLAQNVSDYDIAGLKTASPGFYARLGWESWRGPLAGRRSDGLVPTPKQQGVMMLRLPQTPLLSLDSALSIECQPGRIW